MKLLNILSCNFLVVFFSYICYDKYKHISFQVVVVVGFTPAEEVERTLVEAVEKVEKVVWDFFKEGLVEEVDSTLLMVGLVEEVGLLVEI